MPRFALPQMLLLEPERTDGELRRRRQRRLATLAITVVLWALVGLIGAHRPEDGPGILLVVVGLLGLGIGGWWGHRAQTPAARRLEWRLLDWLPLALGVWIIWAALLTVGGAVLLRAGLESGVDETALALAVVPPFFGIAFICGAASGRWLFLHGSDLRGIDLRGRQLAGLDLSGASMPEAQLAGARLEYARLSSTMLRSADLRHCVLRHARLRRADLRHADLREADLAAARLNGADLRQANLAGASLMRANLRGANLTDACLEGAYLISAQYDDHTQWPEGFDPDEHGAVKAD